MFSEDAVTDLLMADMEYKLQVAMMINNSEFEVAGYLLKNRERLLPNLLVKAGRDHAAPDETVYNFVQAIRERVKIGLSLD